jgi:predicted transcriptional regulator
MAITYMTRAEAHEQIKPVAKTYREQVYNFITERGAYGATDEEIQKGLNLDPNTERPRRIELVKSGHVVEAGVTRKTTSGRQAAVWTTDHLGLFFSKL